MNKQQIDKVFKRFNERLTKLEEAQTFILKRLSEEFNSQVTPYVNAERTLEENQVKKPMVSPDASSTFSALKEDYIEYLEFLLSNRLYPEYSIRDIRREVESKLKELKQENKSKGCEICHICGEPCNKCKQTFWCKECRPQEKEALNKVSHR